MQRPLSGAELAMAQKIAVIVFLVVVAALALTAPEWSPNLSFTPGGGASTDDEAVAIAKPPRPAANIAATLPAATSSAPAISLASMPTTAASMPAMLSCE